MILSKEFLDHKAHEWNPGFSNDQVTEKLERTRKIKDMMTNIQFGDEKVITGYIELIRKCDKSDLACICDYIYKCIEPSDMRDVFMLIQMIEVLLNNFETIDKPTFDNLFLGFKKIDNAIVFIEERDKDSKYINAVNMLARRVGNRLLEIQTWFRTNDDVECNTYITAKDEKNLCENAIVKISGSGDASMGAYDTIHFVSFDKFTNLLRDIQFDKTKVDYLIANFRFIPLYIEGIISNPKRSRDDMTRDIRKLINSCFTEVINNPYGLSVLRNALIQSKERIGTVVSGSVDIYETKKEIESYLDTCIQNSDEASEYLIRKYTAPKNVILTESADSDEGMYIPEVNPLVEMGFGYIYEIFPMEEEMNEDTAIRVCKELEEYAIKNNMLSVLQEGILKDQYEFRKQKKQDDYERKKRLADRKADDEYDREKREIDDKYDIKRQRKLDKEAERKEERIARKQEKKQNKEARHASLANKIRTLPLTSNTANKVYEALRRCVGAAISAGAVSLAGVNPVVGAALYLIPKYLKSKGTDHYGRERNKAIAEINAQMGRLESEIDNMDRKGNLKGKAELQKLHTRLEHTRARIAADAQMKGGAVIL